MNKKIKLGMCAAIAVLSLSGQITLAQWNAGGTVGDRWARTNNASPGQTIRRGGMGNFPNGNPPAAAFHINANLLTPVSPFAINTFLPGEVFRTTSNAPAGAFNAWRMFTGTGGGTQKFSISNVGSTNNVSLNVVQNGKMNFSTSNTERMQVTSDGALLYNSQTGATPTSGAGTRMMWIPGKAAFRAGQLNALGATLWDDANIGISSLAIGANTQASGNSSIALGSVSLATGNESISLGHTIAATNTNSFIIGVGTPNGFPPSFSNNIPNSLMVGFRLSDPAYPTLMVKGSSAINDLGNVGINTDAPGNHLEINTIDASPTTTMGGNSGLTFTDLTNATTPLTNPDPEKGVLSVDNTGKVILVRDEPGTGGGGPAAAAPPAGAVQFNDGLNNFAGDGNFKWDNSNKRLNIGNFPATPTPPGSVNIKLPTNSTEAGLRINRFDSKIVASMDVVNGGGYFALFPNDPSICVSGGFDPCQVLDFNAAAGKYSLFGNVNIGYPHPFGAPTSRLSIKLPGNVTENGIRIDRLDAAIVAAIDVVDGGGYISLFPNASGIQTLDFHAAPLPATGRGRYSINGDVIIGYAHPFIIPTFTLDVNGTARKTGGNATMWDVPSDERVKDSISSFTDGLNIIRELNPVNFTYNGKGGTHAGVQNIGLVGQQAQQAASYMVQSYFAPLDSADTVKTELLSLNAHPLLFLTINAIKQLDSVVNNNSNAALASSIDSLRQQFAAIENCLDNHPGFCGSAKKSNPDNGSGNNPYYANDFVIHADLNSQKAILYQNEPNPFGSGTTVRFYLPHEINDAYMVFYDNYGKEIKKVEINQRGSGKIEANTSELADGAYSYSLMVDGKEIETKQMVRVK